VPEPSISGWRLTSETIPKISDAGAAMTRSTVTTSPCTVTASLDRPFLDCPDMGQLSLYFNPRCSKCRTAQGLLAERQVDAHVIDYLNAPPTVPELRVLMGQLGISDPRQMMRTGEDVYGALAWPTCPVTRSWKPWRPTPSFCSVRSWCTTAGL